MAMTAAQILDKTPEVVKDRAAGARVSGRNPKFAKYKGQLVPVLKAVVRSTGTGDPHVCTIGCIEAKPLSQGKIMVDCTCGFFTYYCEYALAKKGAAVIRRSNGEPPGIKNPRNRPMCCKHLVKVLQEIINNKM